MSAAQHRSHGMRGDDTAPDWPPLQQAEVQSVLEGFSKLRGDCEILWRSPRPFSAAARVQTPAGEVFVKRHHARVRSAQALAEEHRFIAHLRAHGLPVPQVLLDDSGATTLTHGDWTFEVHALADGADLYRDTLSWTPLTHLTQARSAGRMLARLHLAAAHFSAPTRSTALLVASTDLLCAPDLLRAIETQCHTRPALADFLARRDWRQALRPLLARHRALQPKLAALPRLWTHGDWHVSNLCWTHDAQVSAVFDFGLCAPTFALFDLATAIERNAIDWLQREQTSFPHTACALIEGYAEVLPLTQTERALLAELLPLVQLDFALSEAEYFHAITGQPADAELAYSGYLLGHAAWFAGAQGQALLHAVRGA